MALEAHRIPTTQTAVAQLSGHVLPLSHGLALLQLDEYVSDGGNEATDAMDCDAVAPLQFRDCGDRRERM